MASVNKAILIGNLGKDPELKYTPGGQAVTTFPIATTERWNDKSGQRQEKTEWHNIVVWGKMAETANQYLSKGRPVYIEGRISTRSWDDRDGNKRYRTEIVAQSFQFLGSSSGAGRNDAPAFSGEDAPSQSESVNEQGGGNASYENQNNSSQMPVEDDLPF
ncbi:MAG: single-stranded DNA-binding protein [Chitinivibrionales bacterium]|nr:single-stranded DNA-binding protein [Chitinivibrionales bacterium]